MNNIKYSKLWCHDLENTVIFKLLENLSKKKFVKSNFNKADIIFIGPYDNNSIKRKIIKGFTNKLKINEKYFINLDIYKMKRKFNPLRVFITHENYEPIPFKYDYSITPNLGISDDTHLRFPSWKDYIDWSEYDIHRDNNTLNSRRFGEYYSQDQLIEPQGEFFLKKPRKFCMFTSHLNEPRKSIISFFSNEFEFNGYGPYFDKKVNHHDESNFYKKDIMKNYAFNLCPHNSLFPGYYEEKVPDAYLSKCLPITWADQNIDYDFNPESFINLIEYTKDNYASLIENLKSESFLKKFTDKPLFVKKKNLENEIKFVEKIISEF